MSNNVKVNVDVGDKGTTAKVTRTAKALKDMLTGVQEAAANIRVPAAVLAARQGVTASNQQRQPVAAKAASAAKQEMQDYDKVRGGIGTGAAGRDFAKQSEGLGGLVRVYATFAANLFAVTAAYSALSKAADTSNMVKGLDQLGASSGRALGSLAKQLNQVTDGAISMRDAMTATVSASAGGMTNAAILRMGVVAKQASQALGVAMPDALSRISRGITKLEPELLDEIGIMVRVDTASQNYAKTLGKSASALTDFEKRQGFANAVLEQGEKKFGAIKLDTNPYDKLLASMQNLAQSGLELINKVLGPLINMLSSSPTALATVMAGIGVVLLKQAVPAIGAWRDGLKALALEAGKTANRINSEFAIYQVEQTNKHADELEKRITKEKAAAVRSLSIAQDATKASGLSKGKVYELTQNIPKDATEATAAYKLLDAQIKSNTTRGLNLAASDSKAAKAALDRAEALKKLKDQMPELIRLEGELVAARQKADAEMQADPKYFSEAGIRERNKKTAQLAASKAEVLSNVAANTQVMGIAGAWNQTKADVAEKGLKGLDAGVTKLRAGLIIGTSALGSLVNSLGAIGMAVGLAVGAFALLSSWLSKNGEQAEKFNNSVTGVTDAVKTLSNTLDFIADKDPLSVFSVETIQARANALQGLSDSLTSLVKDFDRLQKSSNWFDKGIDALWDSIGKGSADVLSTNIAKAISSGLAGASGPMKTEAIEKLQAILGKGIDVTDIKQVNAELRKLNDAEVSAAGAEVNKILQDISRNANNAASDLVSATTRLKEISDLVQTQNLSLMPTDAVGKLGATILGASADLAKGLQDPINGMLVLNKLVNDSKSLSILSPNVASDLISAKSRIEELNDSYSKLQSDLAKGEKELQELKTGGKFTETSSDAGGNTTVTLTEAGKLVTDSIARINTALITAEGKMKATTAELSMKVANDFVNVGLANLNQSVKTAMAEGGITAAKGYLSVLKEAGVGTADAEAKLAQQELGIQRQVLEASYRQIKAQQENTEAINLNNIGQKYAAAQLDLIRAKEQNNFRGIEQAYEKINSIGKEWADAGARARITGMSPKEALALKPGGDISAEVLAGMAPYMSALSGYLAGLAKLGGAAEAQKIQDFAKKEKEVTAQEQRSNIEKIGGIDTELKSVNSAISLSAQYDEQLAARKDFLEIEKLGLQLNNENLKIATDLRIIEKAGEAGKVSKEEISKAQIAANKDLLAATTKYEQSVKLQGIETLKVRLTGLEEIRKKEEANTTLVRTETDAITSAKLTQYETELQFLQQIGALSAEDLTRKQTSIALEQQALDYTKQTNDLANTYVDKFTELETKKTLAAKAGTSTAGFQTEQDNLVASYLRQAEAQALGNEYKLRNITLTGEQKALQEAQTADMEKMVSATENLSSIFGELGNNIGLAGQAILKMAQDDEKYIKDRIAAEQSLNRAKLENDGSESGVEKEKEATKALVTLDKKRAKDEISNIENVASKSKKMFSEKTAAYKVLNAIEKTAAAFKLAMQVRDAAMDLKNFAVKIGLLQAEVPIVATTTAAKTGIEVAGQAATMPAKIAGVYASFMSALGPFGPPAAALAIAAFIGSFAGGSKGGGTVDMTGLTSADRQEVQGTGQAWVGGQKVDTGGGVFGDSEAKSTAIVDSLEIMRANSIVGLNYDNKMLKALEKLANSVTGAAKSLYSIPGLRQGTNFGTAEGTAITSAGFGASIPVVGKLLGSIFGGKTTSSTSIQSAGIQFKGTFDSVMKGVEGSLLQYKDILTQTTKKGGWFSSDKSWSSLNRETQALGANVQRAFTDIFGDANELFVELGKKTGVTAQTISDLLKTFNTSFDIDIRGLTGDQLLAELNGVIGNVLSTASESLFRGFESFRNFGEDYLETVVRVVDANNKVKQSLTSIGQSIFKMPEDIAAAQKAQLDAQTKLDALKVRKAEDDKRVEDSTVITRTGGLFSGISSRILEGLEKIGGAGKIFSRIFGGVTTVTQALPDAQLILDLAAAERELTIARQENSGATLSFESSEKLVKNAGGLEAFMEQAGFFKENFLSTAEQLAPIQASVGNELARLGLSAGTTKDELKRLVLSQNLNTDAGREMYQSLMDLAPGFQLMTSLTEQLAQETESNNAKTRDLTIELLRAEGFATEALNLERERELLELDGVNKVMQIRINELEDEAKVISSEIALYTALGLTEEALRLTRVRELRALEDILKPARLYLYALQDQAAIKSKLTTAYNKENSALKTTLNTLSTSIKTLNDYRTTLLAGDKSILTPAEKYQQSKFQAEQIAAIATGIATTDAEILAKQEAISKLPNVTGAFLEASRGLYASSEQYTQDFNSVLALLDATGVSLAKQQTDAEKQLETLNNSYSALGFIEENTATTAQLIAEYLTAVTTTESARFASQASGSTASGIIPAFASGGLAQGLALVGEQGPELVDFKTPARVYSNRASNDLLNNTDLINEIKNLRSELTQLRKEQQEQTGYLIKSNYDANARAADKVVTATEDATSQMEWKARSAVKIA